MPAVGALVMPSANAASSLLAGNGMLSIGAVADAVITLSVMGCGGGIG